MHKYVIKMNILVKCSLLSLCIFMFVVSTESRKSFIYVPLTDELCIQWQDFTDEDYEEVLKVPIKSANHTENEPDECDEIIQKKKEKNCTCMESFGLDPKNVEEYKKLEGDDKDAGKTNVTKKESPEAKDDDDEDEEGSLTRSNNEDSESEEFDGSSQEDDTQDMKKDEKQNNVSESNESHKTSAGKKGPESSGGKTDKGNSTGETNDKKNITEERKNQQDSSKHDGTSEQDDDFDNEFDSDSYSVEYADSEEVKK